MLTGGQVSRAVGLSEENFGGLGHARVGQQVVTAFNLGQEGSSPQEVVKVSDLLALAHYCYLGLAVVNPVAERPASLWILGDTIDDPEGPTPVAPPQRCPTRPLNPGRLGGVLEPVALDDIGFPVPASGRRHGPQTALAGRFDHFTAYVQAI